MMSAFSVVSATFTYLFQVNVDDFVHSFYLKAGMTKPLDVNHHLGTDFNMGRRAHIRLEASSANR